MARSMGMTSGEFVFVTMDSLPEENLLNTDEVWQGKDGKDRDAREAFEAVLHVRRMPDGVD